MATVWTRRDKTAAVVVVFTLLVTLGRGLRAPNEFAMTHWLFDYRFGFMKRGLVGSVCSFFAGLFGISVSETSIVVLSSALLAAFFMMLLTVLRRAMTPFREDPLRWLVAMVFVSSPLTVLSAHLIGYFDGLLYLLAALAICLVMKARPGAAGLISVIGVLTHESYLLVGLPLVAFAASQVGRSSPADPTPRRHALTLLPPLLVFGLMAVTVQGNAAQLRSVWAEHVRTFDFIGEQGVRAVAWNTTAFSAFWSDQSPLFGSRLLDPAVSGASLPTLATLLLFGHVAYGVRPLGRLSLLIFFSVLSPLLMHAIAWDSVRISLYPICGALFALWILARTQAPGVISSVLALVALPALFFNIFVRVPLMDSRSEGISDLERVVLYSPAAILATSVLLDTVRRARRSMIEPSPPR